MANDINKLVIIDKSIFPKQTYLTQEVLSNDQVLMDELFVQMFYYNSNGAGNYEEFYLLFDSSSEYYSNYYDSAIQALHDLFVKFYKRLSTRLDFLLSPPYGYELGGITLQSEFSTGYVFEFKYVFQEKDYDGTSKRVYYD